MDPAWASIEWTLARAVRTARFWWIVVGFLGGLFAALIGSLRRSTLETCHWEKQMVVCGSALPGYPVPMCPEWVYVCKFPGSSRN